MSKALIHRYILHPLWTQWIYHRIMPGSQIVGGRPAQPLLRTVTSTTALFVGPHANVRVAGLWTFRGAKFDMSLRSGFSCAWVPRSQLGSFDASPDARGLRNHARLPLGLMENLNSNCRLGKSHWPTSQMWALISQVLEADQVLSFWTTFVTPSAQNTLRLRAAPSV